MFRAGVLISGCGLYDGSEAHEAVLAMLALDRQGFRLLCLAPDRPQMHVVDHTTGMEVEGARRKVLEEGARLSRGRVIPLREGTAEELDLLVVPGGYGCAKNLMTGYAEPGKGRDLVPEVARLLRQILDQGKPLGLISLADLLIYPLLPELEEPLSAWRSGVDPVVDEEHRLVYTPGYRAYDRLSMVSKGVEALVGEVAGFLEKEP